MTILMTHDDYDCDYCDGYMLTIMTCVIIDDYDEDYMLFLLIVK